MVAAIIALVMCHSFQGVFSLSLRPAPVFTMKGVNGDSSTTIDSPDVINGDESESSRSNEKNKSELSSWSQTAGDTALRQVQFLASKVSESTETSVEKNDGESMLGGLRARVFGTVFGNTRRKNKGVFDNAEYNEYLEKGTSQRLMLPDSSSQRGSNRRPTVSSNSKRDEQVWAALSNLELDMQLLDNLAGQKPQLTALELVLLSASVTAASSSPWILGGRLTEVLPPAAAACELQRSFELRIL